MTAPAVAASGLTSQVRHFRPRVGAALTAALVVVIIWGIESAPGFLSKVNLSSLLLNMVELGFLALALTPVIIAGEIDVSVQGMVSLAAATTGVLFEHHVSWPIVLLLVILLGAGGGLLNAVLVARVRLPSLVVTLGTMALFEGLALVVLGQRVLGTFPGGLVNFVNSNFLGLVIPTMTVILIVAGFVLGAVLHMTIIGRRLFFIGQNVDAAVHAGIAASRYKAMTFIFAGALSAVAGLVLVLQYGSASGDSGSGLLLPALTAVVLAGVDVRGGRGNVLAVLAALFLTSTLLNIETLFGWGPQVGQITIGVLLVASVTGRRIVAAPVRNLVRRIRTT